MTFWEAAIVEERVNKARRMYNAMKDCPLVGLSERDKALVEAFGWFCLESDERPDTDMEIA